MIFWSEKDQAQSLSKNRISLSRSNLIRANCRWKLCALTTFFFTVMRQVHITKEKNIKSLCFKLPVKARQAGIFAKETCEKACDSFLFPTLLTSRYNHEVFYISYRFYLCAFINSSVVLGIMSRRDSQKKLYNLQLFRSLVWDNSLLTLSIWEWWFSMSKSQLFTIGTGTWSHCCWKQHYSARWHFGLCRRYSEDTRSEWTCKTETEIQSMWVHLVTL